MSEEVNEHAEIIANTVYHSYPYNKIGKGFTGSEPHSEDCGGCLINAEVDKLVAKLNALSRVEKIIEQLNHEKAERNALRVDRFRAFDKAGVTEEGSVADLVGTLVDERDRLNSLLKEIKHDMQYILRQIG